MYDRRDFRTAEKMLRLATWRDVKRQWRNDRRHFIKDVVKPIVRNPGLAAGVLWDCARKWKLSKSEREFKPFPHKQRYAIEYLFLAADVVDLLPVSGTATIAKRYSKEEVEVRGLVTIFLSKRQTFENVISTIEHEDLHIAIEGCVDKASGQIIEDVIDVMMSEEADGICQ